MFNGLYVVEYSVKQNYFHVETVGEMLESNQQSAFLNKRQTYYVPIAVFEKRCQADEFVEKYRETERKK